MPEITIPSFTTIRRQTRTYDTPSENTNEMIAAVIDLLVPVGSFIPTAASEEPPSGAWKICNGQSLSKADFPRLFTIFGGQFGETAETFALPDLRGRVLMGAGSAVSLSGFAGSDEVFLTVGNLPSHGHDITDPGHDHTFTGDEHGHDVTDPGHNHDAATEDADSSETDTGSPTSGAQAGSTSTESTGLTVDPTTAGGTVESATTGITVDETGDGDPINITPPVFGINWLVRT